MGNIIRGETGEQNAERFIATVKIIALSERYVIMYAMPGGPRGEPHRHDWPWMANKDWRGKVSRELEASGVVWQPKFQPPDHIDGWTFSGTSRTPRPKAEFTPIEEALEPDDSLISVRRIPKALIYGAWLCLGIVALAFLFTVLRHPAEATNLPPPLEHVP